MKVFHKMSYRDNNEMDILQIDIDIDFHEIEKNLAERRRKKIGLLAIIFLLSIGLIIYSVIHDFRTETGEFSPASCKRLSLNLSIFFSRNCC